MSNENNTRRELSAETAIAMGLGYKASVENGQMTLEECIDAALCQTDTQCSSKPDGYSNPREFSRWMDENHPFRGSE